ncbi:MAG: hypothetical protein R8G33_02620 [Gammaproteobacteria bacterium]|nr:hypothetical protein [Gammaproteobacteria bacterium]
MSNINHVIVSVIVIDIVKVALKATVIVIPLVNVIAILTPIPTPSKIDVKFRYTSIINMVVEIPFSLMID